MTPRLGFAGLGWIGRHRLRALVEAGRARAGLAEIAVLQDPDPAARDAAAAMAPGARTVESFEALLDAGCDGVVIASPSALHAAQAEAALARGAAVFCQKPLGRTAAESARVVARARAADRRLAVDLCYPHAAAFRAAFDLLAAGRIGQLFAADFTFHNAYGPDKPWFYDPAQSGGGAMMDLGTHLVGLALDAFAAPVETVSAMLFAGGRRLRAPGLEDYATATLGFAGGGAAGIACSWNLHAGQDAVIAMDLHGTEGGASVRNVGGSFLDFEAWHHRGTATTRIAAPPDDWGGRAAVAWAQDIARGYDRAAECHVALAETLDRIYAAGFGGGPA